GCSGGDHRPRHDHDARGLSPLVCPPRGLLPRRLTGDCRLVPVVFKIDGPPADTYGEGSLTAPRGSGHCGRPGIRLSPGASPCLPASSPALPTASVPHESLTSGSSSVCLVVHQWPLAPADHRASGQSPGPREHGAPGDDAASGISLPAMAGLLRV